MDREILFRGKRLDNGEWVEGSLLKITIDGRVGCFIFGGKFIQIATDIRAEQHGCVNPATIGQYTGLTDKNGKKIFEGDIVSGNDALAKNAKINGFVDFKDGSFIITGRSWSHYRWLDYNVEVIGNIYDNPELLKG